MTTSPNRLGKPRSVTWSSECQTRERYDETVDDLYRLLQTKAVLENEIAESDLQPNDEYRRLVEQIDDSKNRQMLTLPGSKTMILTRHSVTCELLSDASIAPTRALDDESVTSKPRSKPWE
ncbi:HalX domain-containing protein [Halorubrum sp. BV1]|uniref:HalX domain-containing protein n=1 Tax=Halorubrum sp. BV1 TaxID=1498500 RepID=UPI000679ADDE